MKSTTSTQKYLDKLEKLGISPVTENIYKVFDFGPDGLKNFPLRAANNHE